MDVNNQGLNLPSNLQNLDVRSELLSTEVGSGASCAYSLRDLTGNNLNSVRVRRTPYDDTNTIDDETNFACQAVQAGEVEDWVNGKLEYTALGDIATARSLHSLRKIRSGYNGNALRIRRIDNTEVDVAFDSEGKVSTSSSITNITSGDVDDTAETTLGNFLQGEANVRALFNSSAYFPTDSDYFSLGSGITLSGAFTISYDVVFTGSFGTNTSRIFQDDAGNDLLTFTASDVCKFRVGTTVRTMPALSTLLQLGRKYSMIFARDGSGVYTLTVDGVVLSTTSATDTNDFFIQRIGFRNRGSISNININSGQHIYAGDGAENSNWLDTGSGTTTNATKVGTPVAFTGQGMDSFVHTWYNQSGATTGATQNSAQRQPKIATNGTVLDHILFEGSGTVSTPASTDQYLVDTSINFNDALTLGCVSDRLDTTGNGMYPVSVSRQSAVNRFFGIQEASSSSVFITRNSTSVSHSVDNTSELKRFTIGRVGSNSETDAEISIFGRAFGNNNGSDWGNVIYTSNQNSFVIGALGLANDTGGVATGTATFQGKIYETFAYQTDEKDELFKIASNVNNYYGLYDDANDMAEAFRATAGTLTNESKDGFDLALGTPTAYVGFEFNEKIANGDSVFISFNLDLTGGSGGDATPIIRLTKTTLDGTDSSNFINPSDLSQGFNSFELTSSDNDAKFFSISEGNSNVNISISDFKVSRISRNGFVQTWYDQSGSNNNARQNNANTQPHIVKNGGMTKLKNGNPAIFGSRNTSSKNKQLVMNSAVAEPTTVFATYNMDRSFVFLYGGSATGGAPTTDLNIGGIEPRFTSTDNMGNTTGVDNTNDSLLTLFSAEVGGTAIMRKDGIQKDTFTRTESETLSIKYIFRFQNNNADKGLYLESFIIYNSDKSSDFVDIENDLKQANNIS
jgi:hypothetical protein